MSFAEKVTYPFTFSVCAFLASGLLLGQIKMCRVVEYPFRRRTTVRQRRISAREKVNTIKGRQPASGLPAFIISILSKSSDFHKCLYQFKTFPFHFFGLHFFSIPKVILPRGLWQSPARPKPLHPWVQGTSSSARLHSEPSGKR